MKKNRYFTMYKITVFLFVISLKLFCQTYQPRQIPLLYDSIHYMPLDSLPHFRQMNNFVFSWHWKNPYKISQVLGFKYGHIWEHDPSQYGIDWIKEDLKNYNPNSKVVVNAAYISAAHEYPVALAKRQAFVYEPTYKVDTSNPYITFEPRQFDTTRYAFGFANVKGYISNSNSDPNYNRLQLFTDSLIDETVLSNNWISNELFTDVIVDENPPHKILPQTINNIYEKPYGGYTDSIIVEDYKNVNMYFNINLRRIDVLDTLMNNDTLLAIRLPYSTFPDSLGVRKSGYIKFDSIPLNDSISISSLPYNRGLYRNMFRKRNSDTLFITRQMLPRGNALEKDITIATFFICDLDTLSPNYHNYGLRNFPNYNNIPDIDSLKIEVIYKGNSSIAIDWLSINNRLTRELDMGYLDSALTRRMQGSINFFNDTVYYNKGIKPYRWYLLDEPGDKTSWFVRSYLGKLFGKVFTLEGSQPVPQLFYYCNPPELWFGQGGFNNWRANAYIPKISLVYNNNYYDSTNTEAQKNDTLAGRNFGYSDNSNYTLIWEGDSLKRHQFMATGGYETRSAENFNKWKKSLDTLSPKNYGGQPGTLFEQDWYDYEGMSDPNYNQYLFNGLNWWGQIWIDGRYSLYQSDSILKSKVDGVIHRLLTADEIRYFMNKIFIYGGKGVVFDGPEDEMHYRSDIKDSFYLSNLGCNQTKINSMGLNSDAPWQFLNRQQLGGDYFNPLNFRDGFYNHIKNDTIAKYLGISANRLYFGRLSARREIYKHTQFAQNNENEMMGMHLLAGLNKGFQKYYMQDNRDPNPDVLGRFILKDSIFTHPLYRHIPYYENEYRDTTGEIIDSAFYHITLLKQKANTDTLSSFYLGVLNKRTSPHLILEAGDTIKVDANDKNIVKFVSTAELEDSITINKTKWEKYYWKRLGSREIKFFLNDTTFNYMNTYFKITELDSSIVDSTGYSTWQYWKQNKYDNRINYYFSSNQPIVVNLLPGQGKILKLEKLDRDSTTNYQCNCDVVVPRKYLSLKRKNSGPDSACMTLEVEIFPCPFKKIDSLHLQLSLIPDCFKRFYVGAFYKNDTLIGPFTKDLTAISGSIHTLTLPVVITPNEKKVVLKYVFCPNDLTGKPLCSDSDLMQLSARMHFDDLSCDRLLDIGIETSVKDFDKDFNKFFQDEFNNFTIVPNPATSFIDLTFESPLSTNSKVYIVDEQGRILKERIITADSNEKLTIDVNQLSNGTYFIAVYDKDKLINGKPFLIMK